MCLTIMKRQVNYPLHFRIERDVLDWLVQQIDSDEIEEVTDEILDSLIEKHQAILAVFCKTFLIT